MDEVFKARRRPSKVADTLRKNRLEQLRGESTEIKLMRAIKLHEIGQQLKEVKTGAIKPDKHN